MQIRQRLQEDNAVSPVIGVILMVAITVILAAVIASFVLGMGPNTATTPTATFSSEFNDNGADNGNDSVAITMDSGETLKAGDFSVKGTNISSSHTEGLAEGNYTFDDAGDEITAGTTFEVVLSGTDVDDYEIQLIYESGDTTTTMQTFQD